MNYKILYLNSDTHFLFEIKDEAINSDDKSKIYCWILCEKFSSDVIILDLVSIIENKRIFKQGELTINDYMATLKLNNNKVIDFNILPNNTHSDKIIINILANKILKNK